MPERFLPYGRQTIDEDDIAAVCQVLRGEFLTTGPTVGAFERAFKDATGADYAVSCANGTAALHLAALALGLGEHDSVIVPSITFLATANAARYVGADVIFADVDADTGLMTPETFLAALITASPRATKPRAVFPVHLNGQCCDMPAIAQIARANNLAIVEDASHAAGGFQQDNAPVGATRWSDLATFSFHPVKTVASGEGGMVTTGNADLAERLARFRNHGMMRDPHQFEFRDLAFDQSGQPCPWYYEMPEVGFNYRLSDIHAALGLSQLKKLEAFVATRRRLVKGYDIRLAGLPQAIKTLRRLPGQNPAWHLYPLLCDFETLGLSRTEVMTKLRKRGIGTQVHYIPVHRQPYYQNRYDTPQLPGADSYYARVLSLPLFPAMSDGDIERVANALTEIFGGE